MITRFTLLRFVCGLGYVMLGGLLSHASTTHAEEQFMLYDESADAGEDIERGVVAARTGNKLLLLNFGANWCDECRALEVAWQRPENRAMIDDKFVRVMVDVGNWDKHGQIIADWGSPTEGGIPAIVVANTEGAVLFSTKDGQLTRVRSMSREETVAFFTSIAGLAEQ